MTSSSKYTPAFKKSALQLSDDIGVKPAAKQLKMSLSTLKKWRSARKKKKKAPPLALGTREGHGDLVLSWIREDEELWPLFEVLTDKQRMFVVHYCDSAGRNGTRAAQMAGHGGNHNTWASIASENLRKPKITKAMDLYLKRKQQGNTHLLSLMESHTQADLQDFIDIHDDGSFEWNFAKARDLGKIHLAKELRTKDTFDKKGNRTRETVVRLVDPQKASMDLARVRQLVTENHKHEHEHSYELTSERLMMLAKLAQNELDTFEKSRDNTEEDS